MGCIAQSQCWWLLQTFACGKAESVGHLPFFDRSTTMIKVEVGQEEVGDVFPVGNHD